MTDTDTTTEPRETNTPSAGLPLCYIDVEGRRRRVLVPVARIVLTRLEGPEAECDKARTFFNWHDVNWQLMLNARTAPKGGGYDKHRARVTWADGFTQETRFDLEGDMIWPRLEDCFRQAWGFAAEDAKAKAIWSGTERAGFARLLATHDVGQVPGDAPEGGFVLIDCRVRPILSFELQILAAEAYGQTVPAKWRSYLRDDLARRVAEAQRDANPEGGA